MGVPADDAQADEPRVAGAMTGVLLRHLRFAYDDTMVGLVIARSGDPRSAAELELLDTWSSYQQVVDLYLAAVDLTGDPQVGRRCGERIIQEYSGGPVDALLRSLGSPGEVLRNVALAAAKFNTVVCMEPVEVGDDHAVITSGNRPGFDMPKVMCDYAKGVLSQAAPMFGMETAEVTESQCQADGADHCIYHVSWDPDSAHHNLQRRIDHLESELVSLTSRFEALMSTATNLVSAPDIEVLLEVIIDYAADTVRAPQHLLAVRPDDAGPVHVHARGFNNIDTAVAVSEILASEPDDHEGARLVVDVTSRTRFYGRLAALYPEGACFLPAERRLLQAYASHAAAALDAAAARNFAERRSATTQALLTLAASLAEVGTTLEVATKLAEAIPEVVGCDTASVLLWEPVEHALRLGAARGMRANVEAKLRATPLTESEIPGLAAMIRSSRPVFLRYADVSAELRTLLHMSPGITIVVVPITHGDEFFGVVTASVRDGDGRLDDQHVLQQLRGMTDQAATALLNARLLEEIQHQALHDGLTGLPNRLLFKDRTEHAAAQARRTSASVALVFVDLNGFKAINDEHGHSAGDKLLVEVAHRLQRVVRAADTVGRLGGDEFAILLSDVADQHAIEALTARVLHEVRQPFPIRGHVVAVSASLGVAILQSDDDYDSLVHRADLAMYHEKHSGSRDTGDAGVAYDDRAVAV